MKKSFLLTTLLTALFFSSQAQWTTLGSDGTGDGSNPSNLDGTKLEYRYDNMSDSVWFRVTVNQYRAYGYGINIILDVTGAGSQGTWWGNQNSSFRYNRLITAWISNPPMGTVGITDAAGAAAQNYTKIAGANKISIVGDPTGKTYTLGMKRTDIYNGSKLDAKVIAAVGAHNAWNDDLPNSGSGSINLEPSGVNVFDIQRQDDFKVYPNPTNGVFTIERNTNEVIDISIYNAVGRVIYNKALDSKQASVTLNNIPSGVYYLKSKTSEGVITKAIVIE